MSEPFDPAEPVVVVPALVAGRGQHTRIRMRVDTGAGRTVIRSAILERLGYPVTSGRRVRMRSATGAGVAHAIPLARMAALGVVRTDLPVIAHEFPAAVTIDGLLGLDFFRGHVLTLDFIHGRVSLGPGKRWWQVWK